MLQAFRNIFSIPDLRTRVLFTLAMLAVYRVGAHIPIPGVNSETLLQFFERQANGLLGFVNLFSGGAFANMTIFALGIMPYITASIILQLLTVVWPYLERLNKEGQAGRKKITQYTRYGTVVLSMVQGFGISIWLENLSRTDVPGLLGNPGWSFRLMTVLTLTTGTAFVMWLGEQISERGIGNGISLIIYAGIVVALPGAVTSILTDLQAGTMNPFVAIILAAMMIFVIGAIVLVERAQRKIPVQYARKVVGRRVYGGQSTFIPLKVNTAGVIPVIFASSVLAIPQTFAGMSFVQDTPWLAEIFRQLNYDAPLYALTYGAMIIFFCFFYVSIIFNPVDQADNMKKYGGFIPGIRPGKKTAEYIDRILTRLTFGGAMYLAIISLMPIVLISGFRLQMLPVVGPWMESWLPDFVTRGLGLNFFFGGTSLLIVVGVAMDTVQQIESQLIMRHYDGFLKGTRLKGRRS